MKLFGLFGDPVEHSLSPLMHNTWYKSLGLSSVYLPFHIRPDYLEDAVRSLRVLNVSGVNVTVPFKNKVIPYLDQLAGDAEITGSVNTIVNTEGYLTGYSTDGIGLMRSLREEAGWEPRGDSAAVIGTGGASRAICFRMAIDGVSRLLIMGRSTEKARALAEEIRQKTGLIPEVSSFEQNGLKTAIAEVNLVVNTTPLGMSPNCQGMPPIPPDWAHEGALLCDLVYNPVQTAWLKEAALIGRRTVSGLGMLVYQGAESFRLWHGMDPPLDGINHLLQNALEDKS